jgi:hypothetical protein
MLLAYLVLDCVSLGLLADDVEHTVLQCFLVLAESVLFPRVVQDLHVQAMSDHALLKQTNDVLVVWVLLELQTPAILHELLELRCVALAQLIEGSLHLLLLNICILLILTPSWQSLPRETSSQKVKQNMANGL